MSDPVPAQSSSFMQSIDNFLAQKAGPILTGALVSGITMAVAYLHLQGFVSPTMAQSLAAAAVSAGLPLLIHLFDHNYNNTSVTNPAVAAPTTPPVVAQSQQQPPAAQ